MAEVKNQLGEKGDPEAYRRVVEKLERERRERNLAERALWRKGEELERVRAELDRARADLNDFLYTVSHDLREPLRGLCFYAEFLVEDHRDGFNEEGLSLLDALSRLTQRMDHMVKDLLLVSRLQSDPLEKKDTDLQAMLVDLISNEDKWLHDVVLEIPSSLPTINCVPSQVSDVFRRLIENATLFNDSETKRVEIGFRQEENAVFWVRDNGIGIEPEYHQVIFQIFRRLHARDAYGAGAGAGLTIVEKIVRCHGGEIWLESEPGQGSAFFFTLARSAQPE